MLPYVNIFNLLFIDIETVPCFGSYDQLPPAMQELWAIKHGTLKTDGESHAEGYLKRAGVYAEFAKVVCISIGILQQDKNSGKRNLRIKSFYGDNEKKLLEDFAGLLNTRFNDPERFQFCGHNIKEFDIPFLCRRLLINGIALPDTLDISGKRPWEVSSIDTLHLWRFGDYKSYTSLKLLAEILGIPTPKDDIDGKDVCRVYWSDNDLARIVNYCQKDVVTVARLLLRLKGDKQAVTDDDIELVKAN